MCICGQPNVGKSSLLNALLGHDRAIVTPVPGTTRDVVEESLNLDGLPVTLWDTAGIRDTSDQIEKLGVELSRQHLEQADLAIAVFDGSEPLTEEDRNILSSIREKKHLIAINKNDLARRLTVDDVASRGQDGVICYISAKSGVGMEALKSGLRDVLLDHRGAPSIAVTNVTGVDWSLVADISVGSGRNTLRMVSPQNLPLSIYPKPLKPWVRLLDWSITKKFLERIFNDYCVGK